MKTNIPILIASAILISACGGKKANNTVPVSAPATVPAAAKESEPEDNAKAIFLGTWKLFKKEDKNGKVLSTDNQFLEFKNGREVEIKKTGTSSSGGWYIVAGADTSRQAISYLVVETKDKSGHQERKFMNLKSIEEKNLILVDEEDKTMYFQKY